MIFFESLDFFAYFYFFWAFIFSKKFRKTTFADWQKKQWAGKLGMVLDGLMACLVGLMPVWIPFTM